MKANSHGQQRSQDQTKDYALSVIRALCCIAETHRDLDIRPPAAQAWDICGSAIPRGHKSQIQRRFH